MVFIGATISVANVKKGAGIFGKENLHLILGL